VRRGWFFSFFWGGRALNEFAKIDRMLGEMAGIFLGLVLGVFAVVLKGMAEHAEHPDDGNPVSLAIGAANENEKDTREK